MAKKSDDITKPKKKRSLKRFIIRLFMVLCILYVCLLILIYSFQEKLLFHPRTITQQHSDSITHSNSHAQMLALKMADGTTVRGWLVKNDTAKKSPLIIYYGGNAEQVSHLVHHEERFNGWAIALVNYRGYGLSEGEPSEKALFSDALEVLDFLKKRADIDSSTIVVIGRSLGTGIATYVSANRKVKGTVLITPYESIVEMAKEKYPYIPVTPFLKHSFNSIGMAPSIHSPVLTLIAVNDDVIPPSHAKKLVEKWAGKTTTIELAGEDHQTIMKSPECWNEIKKFLSEIN